MLQIIGLLVISWILIWLIEKDNLSVLGLKPTQNKVKLFIILFIVSSAISATTFVFRMYFAQEEYMVNPNLTINSFLRDTWFQIRTVLTEELLFRGVLLYILIKKIGTSKAIILSSILFGMMHWIGIWGNLTQMAIVFVATFAMGLLLAYSYARTSSLLMPFAIHFGWNFIQNYVFPDSAVGNHVFILANQPTVTISYAIFFAIFFLPKIMIIVLNYLVLRRYKLIENI
jgi:hypothetical protein